MTATVKPSLRCDPPPHGNSGAQDTSSGDAALFRDEAANNVLYCNLQLMYDISSYPVSCAPYLADIEMPFARLTPKRHANFEHAM